MCFAITLAKVNPRLQQVKTLILPPAAHWLLRYCSNVEDLACCATGPDKWFVEAIAMSGLNRITKFSVLYPGHGDIWQSRVQFVSTAKVTLHESSQGWLGLVLRSANYLSYT